MLYKNERVYHSMSRSEHSTHQSRGIVAKGLMVLSTPSLVSLLHGPETMISVRGTTRLAKDALGDFERKIL